MCLLTPSNICPLESSVRLLPYRQWHHRIRGQGLFRPSVVILRQWPLTWTHKHTNRHTCKGKHLHACTHLYRQAWLEYFFTNSHTLAHRQQETAQQLCKLWINTLTAACPTTSSVTISLEGLFQKIPLSHLTQVSSVSLADEKTTAENEMMKLRIITFVTSQLSLTLTQQKLVG